MQGNPLKQYAELIRLQADFMKSSKSNYFQALATIQANLGDIEGSAQSWAAAMERPFKETGPVLSSELDGYKPVPAVDEIVRRMQGNRTVFLGEEHVKPQTRTVLLPLLRRLKKEGFTYFAAETFNDDLSATLAAGYCLRSTGTYTKDPVFAEAVTEAIKLGYKLVPYESIEEPPPIENPGPEYRQNFREHGQARKLKERIFDKDPNAKAIVWAGRAHVYEGTAKTGEDEWRPMAHEFKKLTGIDPFSVYLATYVEEATTRDERPEYRYATHKGWVTGPTIFVDRSGKIFGGEFDAQVFFPRVNYVEGRPDFLFRDLGRRKVEPPKTLIATQGLQLLQAFEIGKENEAVPADQILIEPGDPVPALALPKGKHFRVRCIDPDGKVIGTAEVRS